jgi:hypothetical protein
MNGLPGGLQALQARLTRVRQTLTESATFDDVFEELSAAHAGLAALEVRPETDRQAAIESLEAARRQLRFISLAARNLLDLRVGLAARADRSLEALAYLPSQPAAGVVSGRRVNVEA